MFTHPIMIYNILVHTLCWWISSDAKFGNSMLCKDIAFGVALHPSFCRRCRLLLELFLVHIALLQYLTGEYATTLRFMDSVAGHTISSWVDKLGGGWGRNNKAR